VKTSGSTDVQQRHMSDTSEMELTTALAMSREEFELMINIML